MLAFRQCDNGISVVDTSGKLLFNTTPFGPRTEFYGIATSRNGHVFGALVYKTYCAASWFACLFDPIMGSTPEQVVIYDARGTSIYERRIGGDRKHPLGEVALSPQGSSLAVLFGVPSGRVNGVVEIFRVPVSEIQPDR
jgi:hypothetical protein